MFNKILHLIVAENLLRQHQIIERLNESNALISEVN